MKRPPILWNARIVGVALGACCMAAPAQADVLEIGTDGAQWVAGPALGTGPQTGAVAMVAVLEEVPSELSVPDVALADLQDHEAGIPAAYAAKVRELAQRFDISPALLEAVVWQESRWRATARSPKGAQGLAQLMPGTARELGVNPSDPFDNLEGGARYLREQLDRFDGDVEKALAAYNAGPGRVEAAGGIPNIYETKAYVAAIMNRLSNHSRSTD